MEVVVNFAHAVAKAGHSESNRERMSDQSELESLRHRVEALQREKAALRKPALRPAPDVPYSERESHFKLPSPRQMDSLYQIAGRLLVGVAREPNANFQSFALVI